MLNYIVSIGVIVLMVTGIYHMLMKGNNRAYCVALYYIILYYIVLNCIVLYWIGFDCMKQPELCSEN